MYPVAASTFTIDELTDIYNRSRSDYLVPMQMTPAQLAGYVRRYDISLDASCVVLDDAGEPAGIGMLGVRGDRAWVTRLGVMPQQRGSGAGRRVIDWLIATARSRGVRRVQLEVIAGNEAARRLFESAGFRPLGELVVLQRDAGALVLPPHPVPAIVLDAETCAALLPQLSAGATWVEEARSIVQSGDLVGFRHGGATLICCAHEDRIEHVVVGTQDVALAFALLRCLHGMYPGIPATVENVPADSALLDALGRVGYSVAFRRIEMALRL